MPVPCKAVAQAHQIPLYQPEVVSSPEFAPTLESFQADLFVVVAYGEILKQHVLDIPKMGCINLHASLLPKFRGAAPIQRSIITGESETGVTIMHMVKKMDAGDIIEMAKVPIGPKTTFGELENTLCEVGAPLLLRVIQAFEQGSVPQHPQDHSLATFAPKIELEECQIHWHKSAEEIDRLIRGVNPYPAAWCWVKVKEEKKRLKIFAAEIDPAKHGNPGEIENYGPQTISVYCGNGVLHVQDLQLEGKKRMPAAELVRGQPRSSFQLQL